MTTIHVEDLSDVKKKIVVEVPEDKVQEEIDSQYRDLKKNVQIKGFRKGKVPLPILRSYFKGQVEEETARKIIEDTFQPGLDEKKIVPVQVIKIDPEKIEAGKPFKYVAEIEVPPSIEPKDYKGLKLKKFIRELTEEEVDKRIENLRGRNAKLTPIPEAQTVADGNHLTINVKAEVDGEVISALTVSDYHLELGRDFFIPGFDKEIEGMKQGESKQFTMILAEDFPRKNLAGKPATFDVTIQDAKARILPELNDEFAKDMGEFETLDALKEEIRKDISALHDHESKKEIETQIIDQLVESNPVEVPESMVEQQVDNFLTQSMRNLVMHGLDPKRLPVPSEAQRAQVRPSATRTVKAGLILKAICDKESIELSDEDVEAALAERAQTLDVSTDHLKDQLETGEMMAEFKDSVLQEKIYKFLQDNAEITEEPAPPEEAAHETESV